MFDWLFGTQDRARQAADAMSDEIYGRMAASLQKEFAALGEVENATARVVDLQKQIATLEIQKAGLEETFARKEREIEHKLGLERKRQEQEMTLAKREATLTVREEALVADRKRFDEQLDFHEKRFTDEVGYLKELIGDLAQRLPQMRIEDVRIEEKRGRAK